MLFAELNWPEAFVWVGCSIAAVALVYVLVRWGPEL